MSNREAFRKNINKLMSRKNCNQMDLVRYLNVTSSTVSSWVTGQKYPRADMMEKIARFFGVSVFELVCDDYDGEDELLHMYRVLSPKGKEKALERMQELTQLYWYSNDSVAK